MLDSSDSSSEDEEVDTIEDLLDVGDLEYEDEDASSEDGVRRYLRAYGGRTWTWGGRHGRGHGVSAGVMTDRDRSWLKEHNDRRSF